MKKFLLFTTICLFAFSMANAQLYADFDEVTPVLSPFSANGDYAPAIMENPYTDDNNPSEMVYGGASVAGTWEGSWFDAPDFIDFSNSFEFTMLVNAEAIGKPMVKIEDKTNGSKFIETQSEYTEVNEWQLVTFTVEGVEADVSEFYNRIAVFMDFGSEEVGNMWYWDMLIGPAGYEGTGVNSVKGRNLVFSNPFNSQLNVYSVARLAEINLFNEMGQMVLSSKNLNSTSVNLETSQLKSGIYFMQTCDVNGKITSAKLLKN